MRLLVLLGAVGTSLALVTTVPTQWTCVGGYSVPMRIGYDGNVQCMSKNHKDCMWGGGNCQSKLNTNPAIIQPLPCGDHHAIHWGGPGSDNPRHWCYKVGAALGRPPVNSCNLFDCGADKGDGTRDCAITLAPEGTTCNDLDSETYGDRCETVNNNFGCYGTLSAFSCSSTGDPHFKHSDKGKFDFQTPGHHLFMGLTSAPSNFDTQFFTEHWKCPKRASSKAVCNDFFRVKHGSQFSIRVRADDPLNPEIATFPSGSAPPSNDAYSSLTWEEHSNAYSYAPALNGHFATVAGLRTCVTLGHTAYDPAEDKTCGKAVWGPAVNQKLLVERYKRTKTGSHGAENKYLGDALRFTVGQLQIVTWMWDRWSGSKGPYLNYQAMWMASTRPPFGVEGLCGFDPPPPSPPCEFENADAECNAAKCCQGLVDYDFCMQDMCEDDTGCAAEQFAEAEQQLGDECATEPPTVPGCDAEPWTPDPDCVDVCEIGEHTLVGGVNGAATLPSDPSYVNYKVAKKMKNWSGANAAAQSHDGSLWIPADLQEYNHVVDNLLGGTAGDIAGNVWLGYNGNFAGLSNLPQDGGSGSKAFINTGKAVKKNNGNTKACYIMVFVNKDKDNDGKEDCDLTDNIDCDCNDNDASINAGLDPCCDSGATIDCNCNGQADAGEDECQTGCVCDPTHVSTCTGGSKVVTQEVLTVANDGTCSCVNTVVSTESCICKDTESCHTCVDPALQYVVDGSCQSTCPQLQAGGTYPTAGCGNGCAPCPNGEIQGADGNCISLDDCIVCEVCSNKDSCADPAPAFTAAVHSSGTPAAFPLDAGVTSMETDVVVTYTPAGLGALSINDAPVASGDTVAAASLADAVFTVPVLNGNNAVTFHFTFSGTGCEATHEFTVLPFCLEGFPADQAPDRCLVTEPPCE